MVELVLRNALLLNSDRPVDIGVEAGRLVPAASASSGDGSVPEIDPEGRLRTGPLVGPHLPLDAVLTVGQPRPTRSGSLFEGIAVWAERVKTLDVEDVTSRAREVL